MSGTNGTHCDRVLIYRERLSRSTMNSSRFVISRSVDTIGPCFSFRSCKLCFMAPQVFLDSDSSSRLVPFGSYSWRLNSSSSSVAQGSPHSCWRAIVCGPLLED